MSLFSEAVNEVGLLLGDEHQDQDRQETAKDADEDPGWIPRELLALPPVVRGDRLAADEATQGKLGAVPEDEELAIAEIVACHGSRGECVREIR